MGTRTQERPEVEALARYRRPTWRTTTGVAAVVIVFALSWQGSQLSLSALVDGVPNVVDFLGRLFPPDPAELGTAVELMGQTLAIAVVGTVLGVLVAVPWSLLAARTVFGQAWLHHSARTSVNLVRAVPELMWALLFVSAVGLGPLAGTLAIAVGSAAGLARLFADIFEAEDLRAWQAAEAAGASKAQRISWVLLPQSLPTLSSYALLVLDSNVRAASLLGLVGAGGIGMELNQKLRLFEYGSVLTIVLVVLVVVVVLDRVSAHVRKKLV
ncbi:phosphonate ABC transporter, permease protein PhnE [Prauserella oleivorans]|uniref:Phosphonate ABC transporter, permease protein PhnE n=1 Tax=Prauserella oleivorans TaxID=1478153 RepID=A0ABW5W4V4_9PSEU